MFHEQLWLLVFVSNLLHDKGKGELAEDDGFEVPLRFVVLHVVSRRIPIILMKRHNIDNKMFAISELRI